VRRGLHTLVKPQYQLLWVDAAPGPEGVTGPVERTALQLVAALERFAAPPR
jgi:hypothetical protein